MIAAAAWLDGASAGEAEAALARCCGASRWVADMLAARPFGDDARLLAIAEATWAAAAPDDVREALAHHPEIGADLEGLRRRFASTAGWASGEQAGVAAADHDTLVALRDGNLRYRERFGFTFVVCATGKTAAQMLALLLARIDNAPDAELAIAAVEQGKITRLRLQKLVP